MMQPAKLSSMSRLSFRLLFLILIIYIIPLQNSYANQKQQDWVDSVYNSLTPSQRIAQLFIIRAYSNKDGEYEKNLASLIRQTNVGGLCFFQGTPEKQAELTNAWQKLAQTPMLIALDAEWGLGMRLTGGYSFPFQMTLGAASDEQLIYQTAEAIARDCKRMGIHINLTPVADVNNNPNNPVINFRSFGENPQDVARKSRMIADGLQDNHILATAKHFPGHGDTDTDSHYTLPLVNHPPHRLDSVELFPFQYLIDHGIRGIMIAHLYLPAYEPSRNVATTLSKNVVTDLLKTRMGFDGWVITDALDMKGVTKYFPPGEIEVRALMAGNDILLLPQDLPKAIKAIERAVNNGKIPAGFLEEKVKHVLALKFELGLNQPQYIETKNLRADLNPVSSKILTRNIYKSAVTLVTNHNSVIPLKEMASKKMAVVSIGNEGTNVFQRHLDDYGHFRHFEIAKTASEEEWKKLEQNLQAYDLVIIGLHQNNLYPRNRFGNPERIFDFVDKVCASSETILSLFGNPYLLESLKDPSLPAAILVTYQDQPDAERVTAEIIGGSWSAQGHLPVSAAGFREGTGLNNEQTHLEIIVPEEYGIPSRSLDVIDSLAKDGITSGAYPGCEILLALKGKIFYQQSFGNPVYESSVPVKLSDIYDVASITKVAATTLAVMKLVEDHKINLDYTLSHYLPELAGSNKEQMTLREVMAHQARLYPWIPFYLETIRDYQPDSLIYSRLQDTIHTIRVSSHLYAIPAIRDTIFLKIKDSKLLKKKKYRYSDLGFYLLKEIIERQTGIPLPDYLNTNFYQPLGLSYTGYNPWAWCDKQSIMPTENDTVFRKHVIQGDVHDPGAAMLGGISGHAGLFTNAGELAVIFQMLLDGGIWEGHRYLLPTTIDEFTTRPYPENDNRRGIGFDKPLIEYEKAGPTCPSAPSSSFGHSGFTGPYVWADPDNDLLYIFLCNRVYPDAGNFIITQKDIRTNIHQALYDILEKKDISYSSSQIENY